MKHEVAPLLVMGSTHHRITFDAERTQSNIPFAGIYTESDTYKRSGFVKYERAAINIAFRSESARRIKV